MAIAYVQGVTREGFEDTTSAPTGTLSATPTAGNLLVIVAIMRDGPSGRTVTAPSGFSLLKDYDDASSTYAVFYKIAGASEATSFTWTWTNDSYVQGSFLFELSGVDGTTPIDVSASAFTDHGFTGSDVAEPAITTVTNGAWDIPLVGMDTDGPGAAMVSPSGYTERCDLASFAVYTKEIATAGSTGSRTMSHVNTNIVTYSFAVRPSGGIAGQPLAKRFGGVPFMGAHGSGLQAPVRQWIRRASGLLTPQFATTQIWRPAHGIN